MDPSHPLGRRLWDAAHDRFPSADGRVETVGPPPGRTDAVVAFSAHSVVAAAVEPDEVLQRLPPDDLGAPMSPGFLLWLGERLGSPAGALDLVMVAAGSRASADAVAIDLVEAPDALGHPRVVRANRYRSDVTTYSDPEGRGVVLIGRGLCDRLEVAIEVEPAHRGEGLGRDLARASMTLVGEGEPLFAQVTPGNTGSVRAFLAAGFRPICSEVLFLRRELTPAERIPSGSR